MNSNGPDPLTDEVFHVTRHPEMPANSPFRDDAGPLVVVDWVQSVSSTDLRHAGHAFDEAAKYPIGRSQDFAGIAPRQLMAILLGPSLFLVGLGGFLAGRATHDVSSSGQVSYACALLEKVLEIHPSPAEWEPVLKDDAYSDVSAAAGILSALVAFSTDREAVESFGPLVVGLGRLDPEALTSAVEATQGECRDR